MDSKGCEVTRIVKDAKEVCLDDAELCAVEGGLGYVFAHLCPFCQQAFRERHYIVTPVGRSAA